MTIQKYNPDNQTKNSFHMSVKKNEWVSSDYVCLKYYDVNQNFFFTNYLI